MRTFIVDAFTRKAFCGNPAAVCLVDKALSEKEMQNIAMEMNHSETAFVRPCSENSNFESGSEFELRWFTPTTEVPLCGHATLASAAALFRCVGNASSELLFKSRSSGILRVTADGSLIKMDFPINDVQMLEDACKLDLRYSKFKENTFIKAVLGTYEDMLESLLYSKNARKVVFKMKPSFDKAALESIAPNFSSLLAEVPLSKYKADIIGFIVTTGTSTEYDFLSRSFAPWVGIPEDPVTGSSHTVIAPMWSKILGKECLTARQCSRRGGDLWLQVDWLRSRLYISGEAVVTLEGKINL